MSVLPDRTFYKRNLNQKHYNYKDGVQKKTMIKEQYRKKEDMLDSENRDIPRTYMLYKSRYFIIKKWVRPVERHLYGINVIHSFLY